MTASNLWYAAASNRKMNAFLRTSQEFSLPLESFLGQTICTTFHAPRKLVPATISPARVRGMRHGFSRGPMSVAPFQHAGGTGRRQRGKAQASSFLPPCGNLDNFILNSIPSDRKSYCTRRRSTYPLRRQTASPFSSILALLRGQGHLIVKYARPGVEPVVFSSGG